MASQSSPSPPRPNIASVSWLQRVKKRWNLTTLSYGLIGFWAIAGAIVTTTEVPVFQSLELQTRSNFFKFRGPVPPPSEIIILKMDNASFAEAESNSRTPKPIASLENIKTWPWKRAAYAEAIEKLMAAGAKVVAVDVLFVNPSSYGPEDDQRLQAVLQRYKGRVILATEYVKAQTEAGIRDGIESPETVFSDIPLTQGLINFPLEGDNRVHRLAERHQADLIQHLQLDRVIPPFYAATLEASGFSLRLPQDQNIFFYGPEDTFASISFWNVLDPTNWQVALKEKTFKDKIVLIGPTATELQDFQLTPFDRMAGIEIHANALATLLENRGITDFPSHPVQRGILTFSLVIGTGFLLSRTSKRSVRGFLAAIGIALAWGVLSYGSFAYGRLMLPTAIPIMTVFWGGISYLTVGAIADQLEQRRLRRTLERYVAAPIVHEILINHSDDFQNLLRGRKVNAAIMFCDIRGFTTLSYQLDPEDLVEQLNTYFNAMVEPILEAGGTLDKFIGDAVMAEFGSPISQGPQIDAMNAIRAALGMRKALHELRKQWQQEGKVLFFNGIGLNYGELIAGDIGSQRRREFAVIGDAVNVASRVEGMTKNFWTDILITESLYEKVQDQVEANYVGEHSLKGRQEKVKLYVLVGLKGEDKALYQQVCNDLRKYLGATDGKPNK